MLGNRVPPVVLDEVKSQLVAEIKNFKASVKEIPRANITRSRFKNEAVVPK